MRALKATKLTLWLLVLPSFSAHSVSGYRTAPVDEMQANSASLAGGALMYVAQSGQWLGAPNCPTQWAYFNTQENPHFTAVLLAARMAGKPLRVYVDDTLPKNNSYCQVSHLSVLPD